MMWGGPAKQITARDIRSGGGAVKRGTEGDHVIEIRSKPVRLRATRTANFIRNGPHADPREAVNCKFRRPTVGGQEEPGSLERVMIKQRHSRDAWEIELCR